MKLPVQTGLLAVMLGLLVFTQAESATYRINAVAEDVQLKLWHVFPRDGSFSDEAPYLVESRDDPFIANLFDSPDYIDAVVDFPALLEERFQNTRRGTLVVKSIRGSGAYPRYEPVACTGIFSGVLCRSYDYLSLSPGGFNLGYSNGLSGIYRSVTPDRASFEDEASGMWSNDLGTFLLESYSLSYFLSEASIAPIPVPASAPLVIFGMACLWCVDRLRRKGSTKSR